MIRYYPAYYDKFRCIAASCPDSCCQGWDVVIDSDTEAFYRTVQGDFGERLRSAIYTDGDGDCVFHLAEEKKCPFWGADKLCNIYRELGEKHLCETCARFPRIVMDYTAFAEHTLSLACPEAARLILAENNAYTSFTQETAAPCEDYDTEVMDLLLQARRQSADILTADRPFAERLKQCLQYNREIQSRFFVEDGACDIPHTGDVPVPNGALSSLFDRLEYIDGNNREAITQACRPTADFADQETEPENLALYYLYRYYLNAVDSLDVLTPVKLMLCSVTVISSLARHVGVSLTEAAQRYSKEVEQSYENMELLYDALAYDPDFSVENLTRIL